MKALILLSALIGLVNLAMAQTSVYSGNSTVKYVNFNELNNPIVTEGNILEIGTTNGMNFTSDIQKEIVGCTEIRLKPNVHFYAPTTASNSLHLSIVPDKLEIYSYTHTDFNQIHALEKFEMGVELPEEIADRIAAYKINDQDTNGLNPFMEWDVNLKVTYTHFETGFTHFNYGFYFEDWYRHTPGSNKGNWKWKLTTNSEEFKVRYAFPEKNGLWKVEYELYVDEQLYFAYCPFNVNVIDKIPGDGFVKVAENKRVLERDGDLFLPVGHNMTWPDHYFQGATEVACEYQTTGCGSAAHIQYDSKLQDFANSGVNYFRMHLSAGSTDFEFEKIGNYFDRLDYAQEVDKIIDFAESNDMYIDFNMQLHYQFSIGSAYSGYAWDWSDEPIFPFDTAYTTQNYCYANDLNLEKPGMFFTDSLAKKYYKQKLRYLMSRWGYSQHIAIFELMSEINQVGDEYTHTEFDPLEPLPNQWWTQWQSYFDTSYYVNSFEHRQNTYLWQKEMAEYIKDELQHKNQLLTCSYAGPPIYDGDVTYSIDALDLMGMNRGTNGNMNIFESLQDEVKQLHLLYDKPVIFGEFDFYAEYYCSNDYIYKQNLWQVPFTGVAGFNYWDGQYGEFAPEWAEMKKFKDWIMNDQNKKDILLGDWKTGHANGTVYGPQYTEYFRKDFNYITEDNAGSGPHKAFGSLVNLTENYYTNLSEDSSWCDGFNNSNSWFNDRFQLENNLDNPIPANLRFSAKNDLTYYQDLILSPWGSSIGVDHVTNTNWLDFENLTTIPEYSNTPEFGLFGLQHPTMFVTTDSILIHGNRAIIPFESEYLLFSMSGMVTNSNTTSSTQQSSFVLVDKENEIEIIELRENPYSNQQETELTREPQTEMEVYVTNVLGQEIYAEKLDLINNKTISTLDFPKGLILITIIVNSEKHTLRWLNL